MSFAYIAIATQLTFLLLGPERAKSSGVMMEAKQQKSRPWWRCCLYMILIAMDWVLTHVHYLIL